MATTTRDLRLPFSGKPRQIAFQVPSLRHLRRRSFFLSLQQHFPSPRHVSGSVLHLTEAVPHAPEVVWPLPAALPRGASTIKIAGDSWKSSQTIRHQWHGTAVTCSDCRKIADQSAAPRGVAPTANSHAAAISPRQRIGVIARTRTRAAPLLVGDASSQG